MDFWLKLNLFISHLGNFTELNECESLSYIFSLLTVEKLYGSISKALILEA